MRVVVQRVQRAAVHVDGREIAAIGLGLLVLAGFEAEDADDDLEWMAAKLSKLRVFEDAEGRMNCSVLDAGGEVLAVSQFTLYASTKKGNRPSWGRAAPSEISQPLFQRFVTALKQALGKPVATGKFGADMQVSLINDGPVTISIDSRQPE